LPPKNYKLKRSSKRLQEELLVDTSKEPLKPLG
jgi:hypothetical protein